MNCWQMERWRNVIVLSCSTGESTVGAQGTGLPTTAEHQKGLGNAQSPDLVLEVSLGVLLALPQFPSVCPRSLREG